MRRRRLVTEHSPLTSGPRKLPSWLSAVLASLGSKVTVLLVRLTVGVVVWLRGRVSVWS